MSRHGSNSNVGKMMAALRCQPQQGLPERHAPFLRGIWIGRRHSRRLGPADPHQRKALQVLLFLSRLTLRPLWLDPPARSQATTLKPIIGQALPYRRRDDESRRTRWGVSMGDLIAIDVALFVVATVCGFIRRWLCLRHRRRGRLAALS